MADQKMMQQKAIQLQMYREQAKQLQQEAARLGEQLQELETVRESIKALEKEKSGTDALIPLGAGVFLSGNIGDTKDVLVSVGAGAVIKKTAPDADKFIEEKSGVLKKAIADIEGELHKISLSAQSLSHELQRASESH